MITSISVSELLKLSNINIIDIRSIENYNRNHIPNAKNITMDKLILEPSKYLTKNNTYYLYCQKGISSLKLCQLLKRQGYNVVNIVGGYENWILGK